MRWSVFLLAGWWVVVSCSPNDKLRKSLARAETKFKDHIGFILYDPEKSKTLLEFNAGKYFTPASNTKIFTLYTSLQILGDSIPALKYFITGDSLIFWGTGDPSFLYREVAASRKVIDFLNSAPQRLFFRQPICSSSTLDPGWAWDDYYYPYSSERFSFPIYGNILEVRKAMPGRLEVSPHFFERELIVTDSIPGETQVVRNQGSNLIVFHPGKTNSTARSWELPFRTGAEVFASLLSDTLKKPVRTLDYPLTKPYSTLYSIPADSLYQVMMQKSDNFIAEQLLLLCSDALSDTLSPEVAIRYAKKNYLFDLPDEPVWVDGSGLSRYNLFTPRSLVRLWEKIYRKIPRERLFPLLAAGSQSGTLKNWYASDKPYIFGKTGSLSNNHVLSGYLITKKEKVLIFSFMNNQFIAPSKEVRRMMQEILVTIRNKY